MCLESEHLRELADTMELAGLYAALDRIAADWRELSHWQQGEFHHDLLFEVGTRFLVAATNCNGGIKEVLLFESRPSRGALWHERCPENDEFSGELPTLLGRETTAHWFDPCRLLADDARSELRPEHRRRQAGGGWEPIG